MVSRLTKSAFKSISKYLAPLNIRSLTAQPEPESTQYCFKILFQAVQKLENVKVNLRGDAVIVTGEEKVKASDGKIYTAKIQRRYDLGGRCTSPKAMEARLEDGYLVINGTLSECTEKLKNKNVDIEIKK